MALKYNFKTWRAALRKARALEKAGCKVTLKATGPARTLEKGKPAAWVSLSFSDAINIRSSSETLIWFSRTGGVPWKRWTKHFVAKPVSGRMGFTVRCTE